MIFWHWLILWILLGGWIFLLFLYFFHLFMSLRQKKAPYIGSYPRHLRLMKQKLFLAPGESLIDLGCGDGKALRFFSRYFPITHLVWCDTNRFALWRGRFLNRFFPFADRLSLRYGDIKAQDISWYDYIYMFLFPHYMEDLEERIFASMKEGAVVVVNTFPFPWREPDQIIKDQQWREVIFLYTKKNKQLC